MDRVMVLCLWLIFTITITITIITPYYGSLIAPDKVSDADTNSANETANSFCTMGMKLHPFLRLPIMVERSLLLSI